MDLWIAIDKSNLDNLSKSLIALDYPVDAIQNGLSELKENRNISLKHGDFFKIELISFYQIPSHLQKLFREGQ